ncbi:MAG: helix-turn-helix transcriptional regulator [Planctomycetales bacterium]|nr:helix-turn-helix transcriptional regulator [Planctomycetales bacterium]
MTQEKLAFEAGISRNYVSLLELNQKSPTVDVWLRICDALDVSAAGMIKRVQRKR